MSEITLDVVRQIAKTANLGLHVEIIEYRAGEPDPGALCDIIDRVIDACSVDMARFAKELDGQSEDQLTVSLILQMKKYGLNTDHDATSGGHCDIVVSDFAGFLWLGEVKKVSGKQNAWIRAGFDQLLDRYSTGLPAQDRGSLILFCNAPRIDEILSSWADYLSRNYKHVCITERDPQSMWFRSEQVHDRTGVKYHVRHKPISAYFAPLHVK